MLFLLYLFILGLVFGSFANVLIWRIPRNKTIKGRSMCPKCKKQIAWYDNIPLISFLILKGKCRNCGKRISARYLIIEFATGLGFAGIAYYLFFVQGFLNVSYGLSTLAYLLIIFLIMLSIFVIDLEHQLIPDSLIFAGIITVLSYTAIFNPQSVFQVFLSGFVAASFLMFIHIATRGLGMGLGDVKFAVFGGMFVGLKILPIWFFLAFLTGGATGIILILLGKAGLKTKVAFGPFLIVGIVLSYVFGAAMLNVLGLI